METGIRVLQEYVLVKQTMVSKTSRIILDRDKANPDTFNYSFEIMQIGEGCKLDIKVGDNPIFAEHVRFQGIKILEKSPLKMISLVIVHGNDIIAVEDKDILTDETLN